MDGSSSRHCESTRFNRFVYADIFGCAGFIGRLEIIIGDNCFVEETVPICIKF